jgi:hypothetical protein
MRSNEPSVVSLIGLTESQPEAVRQPARLRMDGREVSRYEVFAFTTPA